VKNVLIGAGHRHTEGEVGNPYEAAMNGHKVRAILDLFDGTGGKNKYGFDIRSYTPNRGEGMFVGYLNQAPVSGFQDPNWPVDLMIELHSEGGGGAEGCFVIFPDWSGDRDVDTFNHGIVFPQILANEVGFGLRQLSSPGKPGVMSEKQTGVYIQFQARLGVFRDTAPFNEKTTRMIFEQGAHDNAHDRQIMDSTGYLQRQAEAFLTSIGLFFDAITPGWHATKQPTYIGSQFKVKAEKATGLTWDEILHAQDPIKVDGTTFNFEAKKMKARRAAVCRADTSDSAGQTRKKLSLGENVNVVFKGTVDGVGWRITKYGTCLRSSALSNL